MTRNTKTGIFYIPIDRRRFFKSMALASAGFTLPGYLAQTGTIDRNIYTVTSDGTLNCYVEAKSAKGFYYVSFRVLGANTGTP